MLKNRDHLFLVRPFRRHLFRCWSFWALIVSSPIRCSLTAQLFRVWVRVTQKAPNWHRKGPRRNGRAEKSWTLKNLRKFVKHNLEKIVSLVLSLNHSRFLSLALRGSVLEKLVCYLALNFFSIPWLGLKSYVLDSTSRV